jgi:hypothetical protein
MTQSPFNDDGGRRRPSCLSSPYKAARFTEHRGTGAVKTRFESAKLKKVCNQAFQKLAVMGNRTACPFDRRSLHQPRLSQQSARRRAYSRAGGFKP